MLSDAAELTIREAGTVIRTMKLTAEQVTIGRLPDNDLVLSDRTVSSHHAVLRRESGGYTVTDLGSLNGTQVGSEALRPYQPRLLASGDTIRIVSYELEYRASSETAAIVESGGEGGELAPAMDEADAGWGSVSPPHGPPRPTYPMPLPEGPASRYLRYLPGLYHEDDFLGRFLLIMEAIWEPLEQREDYIDFYANPRTCPASFLRWIGNWLGLALDEHWPEARRRNLLTEAMELYRWRGTRYGLSRMIEVCTGLAPDIEEFPVPEDPADSRPCVFRVRLTIPPESGVDRELVEALVRSHKPAHAGYVLEVREPPARVEPGAAQ